VRVTYYVRKRKYKHRYANERNFQFVYVSFERSALSSFSFWRRSLFSRPRDQSERVFFFNGQSRPRINFLQGGRRPNSSTRSPGGAFQPHVRFLVKANDSTLLVLTE
jgi:hypothetical protein